MSNSSLVTYTRISPNNSGRRTHAIDRITPHCVVGQFTAANIAACFASPARQASCNYGIGVDGGVALVVNEDCRSWCSSSAPNDQRAVTIECASDTETPYAMRSKVYKKLVALCVDICRRNGKTKLLWLGSATKALNYNPKSDEMVITCHRWFAPKACPGDWLYCRLDKLAAEVTQKLSGDKAYKVQIIKTVNVRKKPRKASRKVITLYPEGVYTIVKKNKKWGKLKSGAGWIYLPYTKKVK